MPPAQNPDSFRISKKDVSSEIPMDVPRSCSKKRFSPDKKKPLRRPNRQSTAAGSDSEIRVPLEAKIVTLEVASDDSESNAQV